MATLVSLVYRWPVLCGRVLQSVLLDCLAALNSHEVLYFGLVIHCFRPEHSDSMSIGLEIDRLLAIHCLIHIKILRSLRRALLSLAVVTVLVDLILGLLGAKIVNLRCLAVLVRTATDSLHLLDRRPPAQRSKGLCAIGIVKAARVG